MARISFSPLIEEIVGKLAGSVFQDSYGGMQVRTRVTPRNPQTKYQQLRRGMFGFLSAGWRYLTDEQRQTFIDAASTPPAALNLYLTSNINLTLVNEPTITDYIPSSVPDPMTIEFINVTPDEMVIQATGSPTTVPTGMKLLLSITNQKEPTKIFNSPSDYSPVISFDEGTNLAAEVDILSEWQSRYGILKPNQRLCLQSAVIDKSNGNRSVSVTNCINTEEMPIKYIPIDRITNRPSSTDAGAVTLGTLTIPANRLATTGQRCDVRIGGIGTKGAGTLQRNIQIAGTNWTANNVSNSETWEYLASIQRTDANELSVTLLNGSSFLGDVSENKLISGVDFTSPIAINITSNTGTGSTQQILGAWLDFIDNP